MNLGVASIQNVRVVFYVMFLVVVGGIRSYQNMGRLEDPEFTIKEALIITPYPGASAEEVANEITNPIDNARRWRMLPEIYWHYPVTRLKPAAEAFLVHPTEKTIQAVSINYERQTWKVLDPAILPDMDYLKTVAAGESAPTWPSHAPSSSSARRAAESSSGAASTTSRISCHGSDCWSVCKACVAGTSQSARSARAAPSAAWR